LINLLIGSPGSLISSGTYNASLGSLALASVTSGSSNTALGYNSLNAISTGSSNVAIGAGSGSSYANSESNNLLISNNGVLGDQNTIRIGNSTDHTAKTYMAGVYNVSSAGLQVVGVDSTGHLCSVPDGTSGQVLTSAGPGGTLSWQTPATSPILSVKVVLTSAQIKSLNASPITIVAAPGAGSMVNVISYTLKFNYGGSNVFTATSSQTISLVYAGTPNTALGFSGFAQATIVGTTSTYSFQSFAALGRILQVATTCENQALLAKNTVATEIGGNAANDNTVTVVVYYTILTI
jgi:hypothetical protein